MSNNPTTQRKDREFIIERVFDAPRDLVFQAYSQCEHLKHWWGPTGWTLPVCEMDFRPGGSWFYCMRGPDGTDSCGKSFYREIVVPEKIVYLDTFVDAEGNALKNMPEMEITVLLTEQGEKTKVTSISLFSSAADLEAVKQMGMVEGINQTFDRLSELLNTLQTKMLHET